MKRIILLFTIIFISLSCFSQNSNINILKEKAAQLKFDIGQKTDSLKSINNKIEEIETNEKLSKLDSIISIPASIFTSTDLKKEPSKYSDAITRIKSRETVIIRGEKSDFFLAEYKGEIGYIYSKWVSSNPKLDAYKKLIEKLNLIALNKQEVVLAKERDIISIENAKQAAALKKYRDEEHALRMIESAKEDVRLKKEQELRKALIIKCYGKTIANKIENGEIWIGMTKSMTRESIGSPNKINKSTYSFGTKEQWIYNNYNYLYFDNDKLTSWQESN